MQASEQRFLIDIDIDTDADTDPDKSIVFFGAVREKTTAPTEVGTPNPDRSGSEFCL